MNILILILTVTLLVSLISFIGVFALLKEKILNKIVLVLVSLSAGVLIGNAFLHLIPEALETSIKVEFIFLLLIAGFVLFFLIEKIFHWHCHKTNCEVHSFAYMNLVGDGIHNFIDGLIIAGSFVVNTTLGFATTFAIAMHEIPQEIGDFGVLIHGGFKRAKALVINFIFGLTAVAGGFVGYFLSKSIENFVMYLLPIAAGGFIYIAASDLIPELRKEINIKKSLLNFAIFVLGILLIFGLGLIVRH